MKPVSSVFPVVAMADISAHIIDLNLSKLGSNVLKIAGCTGYI
ncbi:MAG: hypothetical protein Ta2B_25380 [Termitinemataceae bacterium]|nr:MAG: hypothetical protein Ta2B_25380 [Termitinemataceae bacterium]